MTVWLRQVNNYITIEGLLTLFVFAVGREVRTDSQRDHPWGGRGQFGGQTGQRPLEGYRGSQSAQHLEEEVQQLSQMVLDMQARMTDMASNLRVDFQEDASKMLNTMLNNLRQPASARGAETQTIQLQDFSFQHETAPMDEVINRISQVTEDLESKSNTLNDLLGRVNLHDGQIHLLMEAAQSPVATPPPASPASDVDLRAYLDEKINTLRHELMEGMEIKLADMKNSCDYKIMSVQEQCEGQEVNYLSLAELMDSKETDLRSEIQDLKTKLVDSVNGNKAGTALGSDSVLARLENLESRMNVSDFPMEETLRREQAEAIKDLRETLEDKLMSIEDRFTTLLVETSTNPPSGDQTDSQDALLGDVNTLKGSFQTLEERFIVLDQLCSKECKANLSDVENIQRDVKSCKTAVDVMESRLRSKLNDLGAIDGRLLNYSKSIDGELSTLRGQVGRLEDALSNVVHQQFQVSQSLDSTGDQVNTGADREIRDLLELSRTRHRDLRQQLDELGREVKAEAGLCREKTEGVEKEIAHMDSRVVNVESLCGKLDPISGSLQTIKEGLNKHVSGLWTSVSQLNGTVREHAQDIGGLRGTCQKLQNNISDAVRDLQVLMNSPPVEKGNL